MTGWAALSMPHLIAVPVLLPLLSAALMLLMGERRRPWKALINVAASLGGLVVAVMLLRWVDGQGASGSDAAIGTIGVYLPSNWQVPFGIVLVVDRLSALMLVVTALVSLACVLFSVARWQRAGVHFHPLFQLQLMGLNGAFLTADLFNLFIFSMGSLVIDRPPIVLPGVPGDLEHYTDPMPQALVLTAIVIGFATTALFLVVLLALRGLSGGDHVDGQEEAP